MRRDAVRKGGRNLYSSTRLREAAEHAMLGVEHGQVLKDDRLYIVWAKGLGESGNLRRVEVVCWREPRKAKVQESIARDRVGSIQTEVARKFGMRRPLHRMQQASGTDEDGAVEFAEKLDDPFLTRLQDAWAGDTSHETGGTHALKRRAEAVTIEIIERDRGGTSFDRCVQLIGRANEQVDLRRAQWKVRARYNGQIRSCDGAAFWCCLGLLKQVHCAAAHVIEPGRWRERPTFQIKFNISELIRCVPSLPNCSYS